MNELVTRLTSRKFLLALLGVIIVFFGNLSDAQITAVSALIVAFTATEGAADAITRFKKG